MTLWTRAHSCARTALDGLTLSFKEETHSIAIFSSLLFCPFFFFYYWISKFRKKWVGASACQVLRLYKLVYPFISFNYADARMSIIDLIAFFVYSMIQ